MLRSAPSGLVRLAIRANRTAFSSYEDFEAAFLVAINTELDYVRRLMAGTRPLSDLHRRAIAGLLGLEIDFGLSARELASELGLSRVETARALGAAAPGLDLTSRTADRLQMHRLQSLVAGYWECVYWSVSETREPAVSRDLCVMGELDVDNYVQCRIFDGRFQYSGVVFPVVQHLYFVLEKERIFNEVIFYITNCPDRTPPSLRGVIGCLSGGGNDSRSYPCASKVAFRYLGRTAQEVREVYPEAPEGEAALDDFLRRAVPRYLSRAEVQGGGLGEAARREIAAIDNAIGPDAVPFALRAGD